MKLKTPDFFKSNPDGVRSIHQLYHLSSKRDDNGLAEAGVCFHVPNLGVLWDTERWADWLESHRQ